MLPAYAPIGEHPAQDPELSGPCPCCAGSAARRAVWDAWGDLLDSRDFPADAVGEARSRFDTMIDDLAEFAANQAREATLKDDNAYCYEHKSTADDDE